jgi:hypothetical protein
MADDKWSDGRHPSDQRAIDEWPERQLRADLARVTAELAEARDALRASHLECAEFIDVLADVVEFDGFSHDDPDCPEDDTCQCPNAVRLNRILRTERVSHARALLARQAPDKGGAASGVGVLVTCPECSGRRFVLRPVCPGRAGMLERPCTECGGDGQVMQPAAATTTLAGAPIGPSVASWVGEQAAAATAHPAPTQSRSVLRRQACVRARWRRRLMGRSRKRGRWRGRGTERFAVVCSPGYARAAAGGQLIGGMQWDLDSQRIERWTCSKRNWRKRKPMTSARQSARPFATSSATWGSKSNGKNRDANGGGCDDSRRPTQHRRPHRG